MSTFDAASTLLYIEFLRSEYLLPRAKRVRPAYAVSDTVFSENNSIRLRKNHKKAQKSFSVSQIYVFSKQFDCCMVDIKESGVYG